MNEMNKNYCIGVLTILLCFFCQAQQEDIAKIIISKEEYDKYRNSEINVDSAEFQRMATYGSDLIYYACDKVLSADNDTKAEGLLELLVVSTNNKHGFDKMYAAIQYSIMTKNPKYARYYYNLSIELFKFMGSTSLVERKCAYQILCNMFIACHGSGENNIKECIINSSDYAKGWRKLGIIK